MTNKQQIESIEYIKEQELFLKRTHFKISKSVSSTVLVSAQHPISEKEYYETPIGKAEIIKRRLEQE